MAFDVEEIINPFPDSGTTHELKAMNEGNLLKRHDKIRH